MSLSLASVFYCIYAVQLTISIVLNAIVLWMTSKRKEEYMRKYRILLGHMAVMCMRASFTFSTLQMCVHLRPLAAVITTKGPIPSFLGHSEAAFVVFRILFSDVPGLICIMSVSYAFAAAYRYMGITHSKVVRNHVTNRSIICALISVHLLGFAVTAFGYSGMTWDQQFLLSYFPIGNGHMDFDTLYIGSHFTESPNFLIALFFSMGVAVLTIFIVFYCSKKVNDRSRLHESLMRARTLTAQKLLVRALLIQAFMPTVLVIPLFIVSVLTLVVDTPPVLEYFSFSLIGWLPVLDPIITIYFVLPFRRLLLSWMPRFSFSNANVNRIFYDVCK